MNVEITGLTRRFGRTMAVAGVDLRAGPGVFGLLGPNGAGKTSLLRMMATAIPPTSGRLRLLGRDPGSYGPRREIRRRLGYLPQNLGYYPGFTVAEFVEYFALLKEMPAGAGSAPRWRRRSSGSGWAARRRRSCAPCPGGMLRRVGIAQAIVNEPELLLLDEPTAGLDPEQRVAFRALLRDLGQRATVVVSTHLVEDVGAACTEVALMDAGKIVFHGTPGDLAARGPRTTGTGDAPLERGYSAVLAGGTVMTARVPRPSPGRSRPPGRWHWRRRGCCAWNCATTRCCGCCRWSSRCSGSPPTARPWPCRRCGTCAPRALQSGALAGLRLAGGRRGRVDGVAGRPPPHHRPGTRSPPGRGGSACSPPGPPPPAGPWWATWAAWPSCTGSPRSRPRWGGPLWWPAAVGRREPARPVRARVRRRGGLPSRFTAPLATIAAFFVLGLSTQLIQGSQSYWQVSPLVAAPWDIGPDAGVATFYHYLPDLPIAQVMFLAGLTVAVLGALALPGGPGGTMAAPPRRGHHRGRPAGGRDRRRAGRHRQAGRATA